MKSTFWLSGPCLLPQTFSTLVFWSPSCGKPRPREVGLHSAGSAAPHQRLGSRHPPDTALTSWAYTILSTEPVSLITLEPQHRMVGRPKCISNAQNSKWQILQASLASALSCEIPGQLLRYCILHGIDINHCRLREC